MRTTLLDFLLRAGVPKVQVNPDGWEAFYGRLKCSNNHGYLVYKTVCSCGKVKTSDGGPHTVKKWWEEHGGHRSDAGSASSACIMHSICVVAIFLLQSAWEVLTCDCFILQHDGLARHCLSDQRLLFAGPNTLFWSRGLRRDIQTRSH